MKSIQLSPRFFNRYPSPPPGLREQDCRYETLDWNIPFFQIALVLIDLWDRDLHTDMRERDMQVTREKIVPLVSVCRAAGLGLVHAPAPPLARRHPNYINLVRDNEKQQPEYTDSPLWPPPEFVTGTGKYTKYADPSRDVKLQSWKSLDRAEFSKLVRPEKDEPVIATGEELHRLCAEKKILFLLYAGVHTPGCMTGRSYGMIKMKDRGYTCVLVRDCTNGMETNATFAEQVSMKGTIAFLEQSGIPTLTAAQIQRSLEA